MNMKTSFVCCLIYSFALLSACAPDNGNQDMRKIRREMMSREPVKANEATIINQMNVLGEEAVVLTDSLWKKKIKSSGDKSCRPAFEAVADSVNDWYMARMSQYAFGSNKKLGNAKAQAIVEAYEFSHMNHVALTSNVQKLGDKELLFTKTLILDAASCKPCHATAKSDTVGLWVFQMPKKEVILTLADKKP